MCDPVMKLKRTLERAKWEKNHAENRQGSNWIEMK